MPILHFLNNPKDLDPSYKTDLDLWDCFGRKKLRLITEEIRYIFEISLEMEKIPFSSIIDMRSLNLLVKSLFCITVKVHVRINILITLIGIDIL